MELSNLNQIVSRLERYPQMTTSFFPETLRVLLWCFVQDLLGRLRDRLLLFWFGQIRHGLGKRES